MISLPLESKSVLAAGWSVRQASPSTYPPHPSGVACARTQPSTGRVCLPRRGSGPLGRWSTAVRHGRAYWPTGQSEQGANYTGAIPRVLPTHPQTPGPLAQSVEQRTFNPLVQGSSPWRPTGTAGQGPVHVLLPPVRSVVDGEVGIAITSRGSPFLSHPSSRRSAGRRPKTSTPEQPVGSRMESFPPSTWTESCQTPVRTESSRSRLSACLQRRIWRVQDSGQDVGHA